MWMLERLALMSSSWRRMSRGPLPKARIVAHPEMASVSDVRTGEREMASRRLTWRTVAWGEQDGSK